MSQVAQPMQASELSMPPDLAELLRQMLDLGASDLHITAGISPQVRVDGKLQGMDYAPLDVHATQSLLYSGMTEYRSRSSKRASSATSPSVCKGWRAFVPTSSCSEVRLPALCA